MHRHVADGNSFRAKSTILSYISTSEQSKKKKGKGLVTYKGMSLIQPAGLMQPAECFLRIRAQSKYTHTASQEQATAKNATDKFLTPPSLQDSEREKERRNPLRICRIALVGTFLLPIARYSALLGTTPPMAGPFMPPRYIIEHSLRGLSNSGEQPK